MLSTVKVVHVLLGMHAGDERKPPTLKEKLFKSVSEIMQIQKGVKK